MLLGMDAQPEQIPEHGRAPALLTLDEVASRLAVSKATVRRYVNRGEIACVRLGSGQWAPLRIRPAALEAWITEHEEAA